MKMNWKENRTKSTTNYLYWIADDPRYEISIYRNLEVPPQFRAWFQMEHVNPDHPFYPSFAEAAAAAEAHAQQSRYPESVPGYQAKSAFRLYNGMWHCRYDAACCEWALVLGITTALGFLNRLNLPEGTEFVTRKDG